LTELFEKENVLLSFSKNISKTHLLVDQLTAFEFLRNIFIPKQADLRHDFLSKDIFVTPSSYQSINAKLLENALLLAQIYSHKKQAVSASYVDLTLAARSMLQGVLIISGNKSDFPSCIFEVISIMSIEQGDGSFKSYYLLEFSKEKFKKTYDDFKKVK
jgi:hypothetical protein